MKIPIIDEAGIPAWPDLFPIDAIDILRDTVGNRHFSAQMMLEYIAEEKARLSPESLHFYSAEMDYRTAKLNDAIITGISAYWDPSTARGSSDSSVCVLILRDGRSQRAFIHDLMYLCVDDEDLHPMATQCADVLDFMLKHNLRHIAIEVNGLGNAMPEILRDVASRRSQTVIVQRIINHENKEKRILNALEPLMSTGRLFAHERIKATPVIDEFLDWTPVRCGVIHDDGLDAIAGALRIAPIPCRARGYMARPVSAKTEFKI